MKKYVCDVCAWEYDPEVGVPEAGIAPGTKWEDVPEDIKDTFEKLGGKIEYRREVSKIVVEGGKASGVVVNDEFVPSDAVIVTEDMRKAVETLFDVQLNRRWLSVLRRHVITEQNMFVCLGVTADLRKYPRGIVFPLEKPLCAGGLEFNELRINNYAEYENHSPEGCTSVRACF